MNEPASPVTDDDLHAFVDGHLAPARAEEVLAWLDTHPDEALRVAHWHAQRVQLRQWHRSIELDPAPAAMAQAVLAPATLRRPAWRQAAAAALLLGGGLAIGWGGATLGDRGAGTGTSAATASPAFVHDATLAHAVYSPEIRHPVEVAAAEQAHLVQWLSRRLGQPLKAPQLQARGFQLLGGRLLPGDPTPRAQFMYEDPRGRRVTLYITVFPAGQAPAETAFRALQEGPVASFYWVEGAPSPAPAASAGGSGVAGSAAASSFGYALSGDLPSADLMTLARDVYAQLSR